MRLIQNALRALRLYNIQEYQAGDRFQVTANLESGEEIHVMHSGSGWHVGFGKVTNLDATKPLSEEEAARKIYGA